MESMPEGEVEAIPMSPESLFTWKSGEEVPTEKRVFEAGVDDPMENTPNTEEVAVGLETVSWLVEARVETER